MHESESCSVVFDSLRLHVLYSPWNSPGPNAEVGFPFSRGSSQPKIEPRSPTFQTDSLPAEPQGKPKNTKVGSLSLLQGIFPTQELNWDLLHCRHILYQLSYQGSPLLHITVFNTEKHIDSFGTIGFNGYLNFCLLGNYVQRS